MRRLFSQSHPLFLSGAVILVALVLLVPVASAQSMTGTVTGTVVDASGAVVPNVNVTLTNTVSKDERRTVSNQTGYFAFASVVPGTYSVKVESPGFKTWTISGIVVNPGDRRTIATVKLDVGNPTQTVDVEATVSQIAFLDSGERSAVVSAKDIQNLSLVGRDATELIKVLPGMNNFTNNGGLDNRSGWTPEVLSISGPVGNGYSGNGTPNRGGTDLVADGAHVLDPGCNCNATQTINADMVQEVKVQTSNFGADSVRGPVVIQAVGKSGSSEFHGDAYLYARNSVLNSTDWFVAHSDQKKPEDYYYYPGASLGGPVKIPGTDFNSTNKLLFWNGVEFYRQQFPYNRVPGGLLTTRVPTNAMREGNFSLSDPENAAFCTANPGISSCNTPMDPTAPNATEGVPFLSDRIPSGMFDPGALAILKMMPTPNADPAANGGNNYVMPALQQQPGFMYHARVDYNFSDNTKLFVSYNLQRDTGEEPVMIWWHPNGSVPYPGDVKSKSRSHTISANFVKVLSPTLTNEFVFSLGYGYFPYELTNPAAVSKSALGYPTEYNIYANGSDQMPAVWDWGNAGYPQMGMYGFVDGILASTKMMPSISNNVTKVWRNHTLKTGLFWERTGNKQINPGSYPQGQFSFVSDWSYFGGTFNNHGTNNSVANLLLGYAQNYQETNYIPTNDMAYNTTGFFLSDDWKATRRLTLQLGLRFDHMGTWYDKEGAGLAVWMPERFQADVDAGRPMPGIYQTATDSSLPTSGREVPFLFVSPRFGLAFDVFGNTRTVLRGGFGAYRWRDQYNTFAGALATSLGQTSTDVGSIIMRNLPDAAPSTGGLPSGLWAVSAHDRAQPVTYSYNFTISQALPWNSIMEVAYVGNQSHFLDTSGIGGSDHFLGNVNKIPVGAYFLPNPTTGVVMDPNAANDGSTRNQYRPYYANGAGYGNLFVVNHNGWANYNALQVSWNRTRGRVTFGGNYTWSKALGINTDSDPDNLNNDYGILNIDRTHVFNINYQLELGALFRGTNPLLRGVANGWMLSGISSVQSGPNIQSSMAFNMDLQDQTEGASGTYSNATILGTFDARFMPVLTCDPSDAPAGQYVNPNCFSVSTTPGQNGTYQFPYMHAPAFLSNDLTLAKTFKITERQGMQFRLSAFNVFNHPLNSFNSADTTALNLHMERVGDSWSVVRNPQVPYGRTPVKFGRRIVELALKYNF